MKGVKVDGGTVTTATLAPELDNRLAAIFRLADELRFASRVQLAPPINVPAWPDPDEAWVPRRISSRTVGRVAWTIGFALVLTEGWTAASAVLGAPPRPSLIRTIPATPYAPPPASQGSGIRP
jgi:hypothetical protein